MNIIQIFIYYMLSFHNQRYQKTILLHSMESHFITIPKTSHLSAKLN